MIKELKDLEFGDILITRNGERYVVADGYMHGEDSGYCLDADDFDNYNNDLTYDSEDKEDREYDIIKVIRADKLIYERAAKKMTVAEICQELGYDVEIIKEKTNKEKK